MVIEDFVLGLDHNELTEALMPGLRVSLSLWRAVTVFVVFRAVF